MTLLVSILRQSTNFYPTIKLINIKYDMHEWWIEIWSDEKLTIILYTCFPIRSHIWSSRYTLLVLISSIIQYEIRLIVLSIINPVLSHIQPFENFNLNQSFKVLIVGFKDRWFLAEINFIYINRSHFKCVKDVNTT